MYRGIDLLAGLRGRLRQLCLEAVNVCFQNGPRLLHTEGITKGAASQGRRITKGVAPTSHTPPGTVTAHLNGPKRFKWLFKQRQRNGLVEADLGPGPRVRGEEAVLVGNAGVILTNGLFHLAVFSLDVTQPQVDVCGVQA